MAEQQQLSIEQRIEQTINPPQEQTSAEQPAPEQPSLLNNQEPPQEIEEAEVVDLQEQPSEEAPEIPQGEEAEATDQTADEQPEEAESYQVESLNQLAELVKIDPAELYKLKIPVTDQSTGERMEVTLGEYKDSFTAQERSAKAEERAEQARIEYESKKTQVDQQFEEASQQNAQMLNLIEQQLLHEFNNVNWDHLKATDPNRWSITRQEMTERQNAIQNIRQTAAQQYQQKLDAQKAEQQKQLTEILKREQDSLYRKLPVMRDETTREAEQVKLTNYLLTQGYSNDDINRAYDHRTIVLAHKAMLFDELKEKGTTVKKKVAKIGNKKILKPGAKQSKKQQQSDLLTKQKARLKQTGDVRDATVLISQLLNNKR